jgi:hypothetical protein
MTGLQSINVLIDCFELTSNFTPFKNKLVIIKSHDSLVGIATGYAQEQDLSVLRSVQTSSGAHPASYSLPQR